MTLYTDKFCQFLKSPSSNIGVYMWHDYRYRYRSGRSDWKPEEIARDEAQKLVLKIAHVNHVPRQLVLRKWLRSVEGLPVPPQEALNERRVREKLVMVLQELVVPPFVGRPIFSNEHRAEPLPSLEGP